MKKFFDYADQYIQESDWKGICLGLSVAGEKKKPVFAVAAAVFVTTYIPLMFKYVKLFCSNMDER